MPGCSILHYLLEFTQTQVIKSMIPSNYLILYCPLLLLPSIFPSIRVFSSESACCIREPKYWCFCFSISPSNEYSRLISFMVDWFDLLAVQGTLESSSAPQNSKASLLQCSTIFMVQHSHLNVSPEKTIALTIWTFVSKVMSLLLNMLSRFVIAFLPRNKHLNSMTSVTICSDFGDQEKKICHCFLFFPFYLP